MLAFPLGDGKIQLGHCVWPSLDFVVVLDISIIPDASHFGYYLFYIIIQTLTCNAILTTLTVKPPEFPNVQASGVFVMHRYLSLASRL